MKLVEPELGCHYSHLGHRRPAPYTMRLMARNPSPIMVRDSISEGIIDMRIIEHRAVIEHQIPSDAEVVIYNALADILTLSPLKFEDDRLRPDEREEELEYMSVHILTDLLQYFQFIPKRGGEPVKQKLSG